MTKISELPVDPSITGTEKLVNADAGVSQSVTIDAVKDFTEANIDLANIPGTLTVPQGGTGATALDGIVTGTGTSALTAKKSEFNQTVDPTVNDDSASGYAVGSRWVNTTANKEYVCVDDSVGAAIWIETTAGASGGEANTASNQGAGGVGFFDNKNGVDLEFRNLNVASNKLTVALDAPNKEVDIDVAEANLDLANMGGQVGTSQVADNVVTNAKLATIGTGIFKGRVTAGVGNVENLSGTQATTLLDDFVGDSGAGGTKGLVLAPASGDAADLKVLSADGTWKAPIPEFSVGNSDTGLAQLVPTGDPSLVGTVGFRLTSTLLETNETQEANKTIVYKDISDVTQTTYLDETNDKFLFPSNLNTFGANYVSYFIRTVMVVDIGTTNNATTKFYVRLRREVDDSFIAADAFIQSDFVAETGVIITSEIKTFVESETDPFVVDGVYLDILNDSNSSGTVTLQDVSIRIFRD